MIKDFSCQYIVTLTGQTAYSKKLQIDSLINEPQIFCGLKETEETVME